MTWSSAVICVTKYPAFRNIWSNSWKTGLPLGTKDWWSKIHKPSWLLVSLSSAAASFWTDSKLGLSTERNLWVRYRWLNFHSWVILLRKIFFNHNHKIQTPFITKIKWRLFKGNKIQRALCIASEIYTNNIRWNSSNDITTKPAMEGWRCAVLYCVCQIIWDEGG